MKRLIIFILAVNMMSTAFASYETSPGTCARLNFEVTPPVCADTWYGIDYIEDWSRVVTIRDALYQLTTDTTINEITYRKLVKNGNTCVGALRQTDDGMKVYYYDFAKEGHFSRDPQEYLLYDFSANVGDSIDAYFCLYDIRIYDCYMEDESAGWLVTEKDTIDGRINMVVARYYNDSNSVLPHELQYQTRWIQGIGTSNVLWPTLYGTCSFGILYSLCAMNGDEELYHFNRDYLGIENNCTEWHFTALDDIQADDTKVRKFLRDGQLFIQTPLGTFNATGQRTKE